MRTDVMADNDDEAEDVDIDIEPVVVRIVGEPTERDDSADFSSYQSYEVLGPSASGGPSAAQQILPRSDKRLQAVITVYDASGNGGGVFLCDRKQALSGQTGLGAFVATGMAITYKGKDELYVLPASVMADDGDVYVGVIDQRYK